MKRLLSKAYGLLIALLLGVTVAYSLPIMQVQQNSMSPTFHDRQLVIVYRWAYFFRQPQANDIVVFSEASELGPRSLNLVKRCLLAPGALMEWEGDALVVGSERYQISPSQALQLKRYIRVPQDKIFVVGDNLAVSRDSRSYGFVSLRQLRGRIIS